MITWTLDLKLGPQPFNLILSGCHVLVSARVHMRKKKGSEILCVCACVSVHLHSETWVAKFQVSDYALMRRVSSAVCGCEGQAKESKRNQFHFVWEMHITDMNKLLYIYNRVFVGIIVKLWYFKKTDFRVWLSFGSLFIILSVILR